MTEEWKNLTPEQKVRYEQLSQTEKDRYEREMREYKKKLGASEAAPAKKGGVG